MNGRIGSWPVAATTTLLAVAVAASFSASVWAQCGAVANFQSTCTQGSSPRQFQCSLQVTTQMPGAAHIMLQAQSGLFSGQPQVQAPLQNGTATFQLSYQESQFNPNLNLMVHVLNASNVSICRFPFAGPLAACAASDCSAATANMWVMGGGPWFENRASLANYNGPAIAVPFGMQGGPNSPNVARVTLEVVKAERRTNCATGPGPWQPVMALPATAQMGGWDPAVYSTPSMTSVVSTINRSIRSGYEHGFHLIPPAKANNACAEQLRFHFRLRLTFANGCEAMQEFPNLVVNRP